MSNMRDVPVLKAVAEVIKDHVGKAFAVLRGEIDGIRQQIKELPQPAIGPAGPPGPEGAAGLPGASGDAGPAGKDGPEGGIGPAGAKGDKGDLGERGEAGPAGAQGEKGLTGETGARGSSVHLGEGPPAFEGKSGDSYIDAKSWDVYRWS